MAIEVSVHQVARGVLWAELRHVVHLLRGWGLDSCELIFGWHWGMEYPPGTPWATMLVPLGEVEAEVRKPEDAGFGTFGRDDVTIQIPSMDCVIEFCHHLGIHVTVPAPMRVAPQFLDRWTTEGLSPLVRECPTTP